MFRMTPTTPAGRTKGKAKVKVKVGPSRAGVEVEVEVADKSRVEYSGAETTTS